MRVADQVLQRGSQRRAVPRARLAVQRGRHARASRPRPRSPVRRRPARPRRSPPATRSRGARSPGLPGCRQTAARARRCRQAGAPRSGSCCRTCFTRPGFRDDTLRQVVGGSADDGYGRSQLVRHAGDELHLLSRERLCPARRDHDEPDAHGHEHEDAEAERRGCASARGSRPLRANRPGGAPAGASARASSPGRGAPLSPGRRPKTLKNRFRRGSLRGWQAQRGHRLPQQRELIRPDAEAVHRHVGPARQRRRVTGLRLEHDAARALPLDDRDVVVARARRAEVAGDERRQDLSLDQRQVQQHDGETEHV